MEKRKNLNANFGIRGKYPPKKLSISETNVRPMSFEMLKDRAKPEADFVELEGGFTMYPSEIQEFSSGDDSTI